MVTCWSDWCKSYNVEELTSDFVEETGIPNELSLLIPLCRLSTGTILLIQGAHCPCDSCAPLWQAWLSCSPWSSILLLHEVSVRRIQTIAEAIAWLTPVPKTTLVLPHAVDEGTRAMCRCVDSSLACSFLWIGSHPVAWPRESGSFLLRGR